MGNASFCLGRANDKDMRNIEYVPQYLRGNIGIMTVQPMQFGMEAAEKAHEGSVLTHSESDWAGDADRFSVSGTVVSLRQTWLISRDCIQPEAIDNRNQQWTG